MPTRLSPHFTLEEMVFSQTATRLNVDNRPTRAHIHNLRHLCEKVLEPVRVVLNAPIFVSSGFRSPALNRLVHGVSGSQHLQGEAADCHCSAITTRQLLRAFLNADVPFDQLILEQGRQSSWVHVSCSRQQRRGESSSPTFRRMEAFSIRRLAGRRHWRSAW